MSGKHKPPPSPGDTGFGCLSLPAGKTTRTTSKEFSGTLPFPFPWQVNQLCRDSFMHPLLGLRVRFNTLSPKLNTDMGDGLMKR